MKFLHGCHLLISMMYFLCFLVLTLLLCCHLVFNNNDIFQELEQVKARQASKLLLLLRLDFTMQLSLVLNSWQFFCLSLPCLRYCHHVWLKGNLQFTGLQISKTTIVFVWILEGLLTSIEQEDLDWVESALRHLSSINCLATSSPLAA